MTSHVNITVTLDVQPGCWEVFHQLEKSIYLLEIQTLFSPIFYHETKEDTTNLTCITGTTTYLCYVSDVRMFVSKAGTKIIV